MTSADGAKTAAKSKNGKKRGTCVPGWAIAGAIAVIVGLIGHTALKEAKVQDMLTKIQVLDSSVLDDISSSLQDLTSQIPAFNLSAVLPLSTDTSRPGLELAEQGYKAKHPVVIVPGFVTSGLELWQGQDCARKYFRQRMWGTMTMMKTFLNDKDCWQRHMALDPVTGLDPKGVKIRAATGLEAVDYFIRGYWVFDKVIEALADVGYDNINLVSLSYDWRLSMANLEHRDGYFTRMKMAIEMLHTVHKERVAMISHSMGGQVAFGFLQWAEQQEPGWTDKYVAQFINIAGTMLGVPKAVSAVLSGEMRDTAQLITLASYMTDSLMSREKRADLWRTWGSCLTMLPLGGTKIWGNATWAPDDDDDIRKTGRSYGAFISSVSTSKKAAAEAIDDNNKGNGSLSSSGLSRADQRTVTETLKGWLGGDGAASSGSGSGAGEGEVLHLDVDQTLLSLVEAAGEVFANHMRDWSAAVIVNDTAASSLLSGLGSVLGKRKAPLDPSLYDVTRTPLPKAPAFEVYCLYGSGIPTERSYHYLKTEPPPEEANATEGWRINTLISDQDSGLDRGVQMSDGDGTVPLITLGLICRKWTTSKTLNPSGVRVVTREYEHKPVSSLLDPRGGPDTSSHVEILGNSKMLVDLIKVVTGRGNEVHDLIRSRIDTIADHVDM